MSDKKIKVVVRTRPSSDFAQEYLRFGENLQTINIHQPKGSDGGYINNQQEDWNFKVNKVLNNVSQEQVFEEFGAPLVKSVVDGFNATLMAYGQTGAGKTFTMTGATESFKHRGISPRAMSLIFHEIQRKSELCFTVQVSYLEIYNESMVDLLQNEKGETSLHVVDDADNCSFVKGLTKVTVKTEEEALRVLFEGEANRSLSEHKLNRSSSRSHCIFTVFVESRSRIESTEKVLLSRLNLVDLAGSERLNKTNSKGITLKEAMYINRSLTFLEQVVIALADKQREHVPFRQCKLTNVLRNSLGGNCQTVLLANIRTEASHLEETVSTLRFAARMMCVTNTPVQNVQYDSAALLRKYEQDIVELKQELAMHDALSNRANVAYDQFSEAQIAELQKQILSFIEHDYETIEITSLRQIKETLNQFRILYRQLKQRSIHGSNSMAADNTLEDGTPVALPKNSAEGLTYTGSDAGNVGHLETHVEDGVGETDDSGFGVGVASNGVRIAGKDRHYTANTYDKKDAKQAPSNANPATNVAAKKSSSSTVTGVTAAVAEAQKEPTPVGKSDKDAKKLATASPGAATAAPKGAAATSSQLGTTSSPNLAPSEQTTEGTAASYLTSSLAESLDGQMENLGTFSGASRAVENGGKRTDALKSPPSRSEEFEHYKQTKGLATNKVLNAAKHELRQKKLEAKRVAGTLNAVKKMADLADAELKNRKLGREGEKSGDVDSLVLDEEEYRLLESLQQYKQQYAQQHGKLRQLQQSIEALKAEIDSAREKLINDFEAHYDASFGSQVIRGPESALCVDDVLDFGEKFEKLQLERIYQEDPDSVAYYSARKAMESKLIYHSKSSNQFNSFQQKRFQGKAK